MNRKERYCEIFIGLIAEKFFRILEDDKAPEPFVDNKDFIRYYFTSSAREAFEQLEKEEEYTYEITSYNCYCRPKFDGNGRYKEFKCTCGVMERMKSHPKEEEKCCISISQIGVHAPFCHTRDTEEEKEFMGLMEELEESRQKKSNPKEEEKQEVKVEPDRIWCLYHKCLESQHPRRTTNCYWEEPPKPKSEERKLLYKGKDIETYSQEELVDIAYNLSHLLEEANKKNEEYLRLI